MLSFQRGGKLGNQVPLLNGSRAMYGVGAFYHAAWLETGGKKGKKLDLSPDHIGKDLGLEWIARLFLDGGYSYSPGVPIEKPQRRPQRTSKADLPIAEAPAERRLCAQGLIIPLSRRPQTFNWRPLPRARPTFRSWCKAGAAQIICCLLLVIIAFRRLCLRNLSHARRFMSSREFIWHPPPEHCGRHLAEGYVLDLMHLDVTPQLAD